MVDQFLSRVTCQQTRLCTIKLELQYNMSVCAGSMILMEQFTFGPRGCIIKWTVREWAMRRGCCEESMIRSAARNAYVKLSTSTHVHGVGNSRTRQNTWLIT